MVLYNIFRWDLRLDYGRLFKRTSGINEYIKSDNNISFCDPLIYFKRLVKFLRFSGDTFNRIMNAVAGTFETSFTTSRGREPIGFSKLNFFFRTPVTASLHTRPVVSPLLLARPHTNHYTTTALSFAKG